MSARECLEFDGITGEVEPIPTPKGKRYRAKLDTIKDIRSEMARIYRETRSGLIAVGDCSKLVYVLKLLADVTVTSGLETRLENLEQANELKK